jgi:hypothetical protein
LRLELEKKLKNMKWLVLRNEDDNPQQQYTITSDTFDKTKMVDILTSDFILKGNMFDFYLQYFKEFGELLTRLVYMYYVYN